MIFAFVLLFNIIVHLDYTVLHAKAIKCKGIATYKLVFEADWTSHTHTDFPRIPHFSSIVGCSHNASYVMWRPGMKATKGVKDVAEEGKNEVFQLKSGIFSQYHFVCILCNLWEKFAS